MQTELPSLAVSCVKYVNYGLNSMWNGVMRERRWYHRSVYLTWYPHRISVQLLRNVVTHTHTHTKAFNTDNKPTAHLTYTVLFIHLYLLTPSEGCIGSIELQSTRRKAVVALTWNIIPTFSRRTAGLRAEAWTLDLKNTTQDWKSLTRNDLHAFWFRMFFDTVI